MTINYSLKGDINNTSKSSFIIVVTNTKYKIIKIIVKTIHSSLRLDFNTKNRDKKKLYLLLGEFVSYLNYNDCRYQG